MVGRTRLFQNAGSPLIHGRTGARRRRVWPWIVVAVVAAAAVCAYVLFVMR